MKPKRLLAVGVFLASVTAASVTGAQKPSAPQPTEQQKLKERVDAHDADIKALNEKTDRAAFEKDRIDKIQQHYEDYYEKVHATEMHVLEAITAVFALFVGFAALFGFSVFDQRIQGAVSKATTDLETKFDKKLADALQPLEESNAAEMKRLKEATEKTINELAHDVRIRANYQFRFSQGLTLGAAGELGRARFQYRLALAAYEAGKPRNIISKDSAVIVLKNIFGSLKREDGSRYVDNARKELAKKLYDDLDEELARVALEIDWLGSLLLERQESASTTPEPVTPTPSQAPAQKPAAPEPDKAKPPKREELG